mgnify:CR=1 FL=1
MSLPTPRDLGWTEAEHVACMLERMRREQAFRARRNGHLNAEARATAMRTSVIMENWAQAAAIAFASRHP